jgi:Uncharacterised nucleotidyltransferase
MSLTPETAFPSVEALRPEARLLLYSARTRPEPRRAQRLGALLKLELNWSFVLGEGARHEILPLLYWTLRREFLNDVPGTVIALLENYFHLNARRNLFLTGRLVSLLNLFNRHRISAVPFKGPALALSAYGGLALRQFSDLDLMVHRSNIREVKRVLTSEGFRPWKDLREDEESLHLARAHAYTFFSPDNAYAVDVHWNLAEKLSPLWCDFDYLWPRVRRTVLAGTPALVFPPEDTLLMLCVHGSRNHWEQLKLVCDIGEFIRAHDGLNWASILKRARGLGSERMLFLGLLLSKALLDIAPPDSVLRAARTSRSAEMIVARVYDRLFSERDIHDTPLKSMASYLGARERVRDKLSWLASCYWITPNTKDRDFLPIPHALSFLYYLIRPVRLARDCWLELSRYLRRLCCSKRS